MYVVAVNTVRYKSFLIKIHYKYASKYCLGVYTGREALINHFLSFVIIHWHQDFLAKIYCKASSPSLNHVSKDKRIIDSSIEKTSKISSNIVIFSLICKILFFWSIYITVATLITEKIPIIFFCNDAEKRLFAYKESIHLSRNKSNNTLVSRKTLSIVSCMFT